MGVTKKLIIVRNLKQGGVKTILDDIILKYPEITILSYDSNKFIFLLRLLPVIFFKNNTINIHGWIGLSFFTFLKKINLLNCNIIYSLHSDPNKELTNPNVFNKMLNIADKISFVSEYHLKSAIDKMVLSPKELIKLKKISTIIYYKLEINKISNLKSYNFKTKGKRVGLITRLSKEKGIDEICNALQNKYDVYIWGDGPMKNELLRKYPKINFMGLSSNFKKDLKDIDVFVFSSKWGVWGISLLEAISIGKRFVFPRNENWIDLFPLESHPFSFNMNNLKSLEASIENSLKSSPELYAYVSHIILSHPKYNHIDMYAEL